MSEDTAIVTKYCSNCKKDIAEANFTMHEVHCRRHLVLCAHCQEPVPRSEMEQHFTDVHAKVACTQCSMELEKDQLDAHLESACPKRDVECEFCELQMPHSDLAPHLEFCGTRTEACPRCGNFIMHKDLTRHNTSNCTFPEVKPPPGHRDRGGGDDTFADRNTFGGFFGHGAIDDSFDPFVFEEIRQALEGNSDGRGMPSVVTEDSDASAAAGGFGNGRRERGGRVQRGGRVERGAAVPGRKKNNTTGGGGARKTTTNQRSEINRQREQASPPGIPPDVDYDTMLAMQLAEETENLDLHPDPDPDPDADLNQLISNFGHRSRQNQQPRLPMEVDDATMPASPPPGYQEFAATDEDMIPCEFCNETFPVFALVHHQSVCDPLASGLWGQGLDIPPAIGRNNAPDFNHWSSAVSRPPTIPVINNLGPASPAEEHEDESTHHLTDNGDHLLNSLENTMLPCEFCSELLPADSLVQHQAMCERIPSTPRVMTPAAALPSSGSSPPAGHGQRSHFFPTAKPASRRQQPDPTEELMALISRGGQQENNAGAGNLRPKKKPNVPKAANPWERTGMSITASRPPGSRPLQTRDIGGPAEEEQDVSLHSRRGSRQGQGRTDSANRTRHTLDALLADEGREGQGGVGGGGGGGATAANRRAQGSRKRTSITGPSSSTSANTGVSSRTVMRNLQQGQRQRPQQARGEGDPEGEGEAGGRLPSQRERGDHVFNRPGVVRNPAPQNRPRRNQDRQLPEWN